MTKLRRYGTVTWNSLGIDSKRGNMGCNGVFANDVAGKEKQVRWKQRQKKKVLGKESILIKC